MIKVFSFIHTDSDGDESEPTYHETEDIAYRAACAHLLEHELENLDLSDEDQRFFVRQFLSHVEAGDYRAAAMAYNARTQAVTVSPVDLVQEHQLEVFGLVSTWRKNLATAEENAG